LPSRPTSSACTTSSPRPARGQGLATALCLHLLNAGVRAGRRHAYLQVDSDNTAARAVYHRLGFADAYAYHYRTPTRGGLRPAD
jgi:predicted GNAT family acetyltransferase